MAQEVKIAGVTYSDVPSISLPDSNGNYHSFVDATTVASSWTKVAETTYTVSTTSTSITSVGTWDTGSADIWTSAKMIYIRVRDTAGPRAGYFYGNDIFYSNSYPASGSTGGYGAAGKTAIFYDSNGNPFTSTASGTSGYGVYTTYIESDGKILVKARCHSTYVPTLESTYKLEVYTLDYPDGTSPFT